jgi:hypothetical protein
MATIEVNSAIVAAGLAFPNSVAMRTATGGIQQEVEVAAGKTGSLTTRTNSTDGVVTLTAGHGLSSGTFDLYWAGGERHQVSAVIITNACTISLGSGDNLPDQATAVIVSARTELDCDFDGDLLIGAAMYAATRAGVEFVEDDDSNLLNVALAAGEAYAYLDDSGLANPLASAAVGKIVCSSATAAAVTIKIGVVYESEL